MLNIIVQTLNTLMFFNKCTLFLALDEQIQYS